MFPDQHNGPSSLPQPQSPQNSGHVGAQGSFQPHAPHASPMHYQDVQQHESGHYEVVPPVNNMSGASGHNPYEFIVAPNTGVKTAHPLASGSFGKQIGIIAGAALVLIIGMWIAFKAFSPKGNTASLIAIVQRQQEISRITSAAIPNVSGTDSKNFVSNANISVASDEKTLVTYLGSHGVKVKGKLLSLDKNTQTDTLLANARAAGTYDKIAVQILASQLASYEQLIKTAYNQTTSTAGKKLLQQSFTNTEALVKQATTVQSKS